MDEEGEFRPRPRPNREMLLLMLFIIMLLTPNTPNSFNQRDDTDHRLQQMRDRQHTLQGANTTSDLVDLTPFDQKAIERARLMIQYEPEAPRYHNLTGTLYGEWDSWHVDAGVEDIKNRDEWLRLLNSSQAQVEMSITETSFSTETGVDNFSAASIVFTLGRKWLDQLTIRTTALHNVANGSFLAATPLESYDGIASLVGFTPFPDQFTSTKQVALAIMEKNLEILEQSAPFIAMRAPVTNDTCEWVALLSSQPVAISSQAELDDIETGLRTKSRRDVPAAPLMVVSGVLLSPDCGLSLTLGPSTGPKYETRVNSLLNFASFQLVVTLLQIAVQIRQMRISATPSALAQISFWTIAVQAYVDGFCSMLYFHLAVFSQSLFVTFITCTFCTFISASLFSLRFMILVHGVHNTEQAAHEEERRRDAGTAGLMDATRPTGPAGGTGANMANVPNAPPTFFGSLYGKFYLSLVASMFVFSQLYIMPHSIQRVALYAFIVASCGLWLPQIYRNILRGTPKPLSATYIVGMSMSRMATILYIGLAPADVFAFHVSKTLVVSCLLFFWVQLFIMGVQAVLGPRFLIPPSLVPPIYDYHQMIRAEDIESAQDLLDKSGSIATPGHIDCAICMNPVEVVTTDSHASYASSLLARRAYMITPCRHVFHTQCLEGWMGIRLACPVCRHSLPPI